MNLLLYLLIILSNEEYQIKEIYIVKMQNEFGTYA